MWEKQEKVIAEDCIGEMMGKSKEEEKKMERNPKRRFEKNANKIHRQDAEVEKELKIALNGLNANELKWIR